MLPRAVYVSVYMYEPKYVLKHNRDFIPFHVLHSTVLHYVSRITGRKSCNNCGLHMVLWSVIERRMAQYR